MEEQEARVCSVRASEAVAEVTDPAAWDPVARTRRERTITALLRGAASRYAGIHTTTTGVLQSNGPSQHVPGPWVRNETKPTAPSPLTSPPLRPYTQARALRTAVSRARRTAPSRRSRRSWTDGGACVTLSCPALTHPGEQPHHDTRSHAHPGTPLDRAVFKTHNGHHVESHASGRGCYQPSLPPLDGTAPSRRSGQLVAGGACVCVSLRVGLGGEREEPSLAAGIPVVVVALGDLHPGVAVSVAERPALRALAAWLSSPRTCSGTLGSRLVRHYPGGRSASNEWFGHGERAQTPADSDGHAATPDVMRHPARTTPC